MHIAIIGFGRMGRAIVELAKAKGHKLTVITRNEDLRAILMSEQPDVAIEFTLPEAAPGNIKLCLESGVPVVCGTTGWNEYRSEIESICVQNNGALFVASNFSLGVNLFFRINEQLATLMKGRQEYHPAIHEIHHTGKKDAPSGTAITLADGILRHHPDLAGWSSDGKDLNKLQVTSERIDPYPGRHEVRWTGPVDSIEIIHHADSREGFAAGALAVAEWLPGKSGVLGMSDFLPA